MTALIAVATDGQIRSYRRASNGALTQVAQFLVAVEIDPAELATIVADLGDRFGWAEESATPQARPAPRLPASSTAGRAASAPPRKPARHREYRPTPDERRAEAEAIAAYIRAHPGCTKHDIAVHIWPDEIAATGRDSTGRLGMRIRQHINQSGLNVRHETGTGLGHPDLLFLDDRNGDHP